MGEQRAKHLKIASKSDVMLQEVHKKSLLYTLKENKYKVKKATKNLLLFTLVFIAFLLVIAYQNITQWYAFILIFTCLYVGYLCYHIFSLWRKHKKIKEKIKLLK